MFRWLRRHHDIDLPEPHVDEARMQAARDARRASEEKLQEVKRLEPEIHRLVANDRQLRRRNGFADIVYDAFRGV